MTKIDVEDLIGVHEIAKVGRVTPSCVSMWRTRYDDFPKPIKILKMGPLFSETEVIEWMEKHDK